MIQAIRVEYSRSEMDKQQSMARVRRVVPAMTPKEIWRYPTELMHNNLYSLQSPYWNHIPEASISVVDTFEDETQRIEFRRVLDIGHGLEKGGYDARSYLEMVFFDQKPVMVLCNQQVLGNEVGRSWILDEYAYTKMVRMIGSLAPRSRRSTSYGRAFRDQKSVSMSKKAYLDRVRSWDRDISKDLVGKRKLFSLWLEMDWSEPEAA